MRQGVVHAQCGLQKLIGVLYTSLVRMSIINIVWPH